MVAYNAGNLKDVAELFAAMYPERAILIAGDNDHKREREIDPRTGQAKPNVGKVRAGEAAASIGSVAILPPFQPHEKGSDWNDLANLRGPATTRSLLRQMIAETELRAKPVERQAERLKENGIPFERRRSQDRQQPRREAGVEMER